MATLDEVKKPKGKMRESCVFLCHTPLAIRASGQYINTGQIADLSDCEDAFIRWALEHGAIETSDGEPVNVPTGNVIDRKPCPCQNKER